ncbi:MAG: penicillin-binding transpeptidase domain-containing protein [Candidatus Nanopelagicales bacterium]|nr:penicillin-binding transpeptidase domain-containing protein [Candidatus Nanopelagicales bacterium]MDZ4248767.1 penicillin-binding transpeptidase domain-containing protein [Candidatus Nanopelagicales bacterium]
MTRSIIRLSGVLAALLIAVIANLTYIQAFQANEYRTAAGNARAIMDEYSRERGPILVGREAVARSVRTKGKLKYLREYPQGDLYAPATGFYSQVYGATGIEKFENPILSGLDDRLIFDRLQQLFAGRDPQGGSVTLTLNAAAQQAAFSGLAGRNGAVAAINPSTGELLALVQSPSFDPNKLSSHNSKSIQATYEELIKDPNDPLLNRPLAAADPPGSSFKVVVSAAALESGRFTPDTVIPGPAAFTLPGTTTKVRNASRAACGPNDKVTLAEALVVSCNTAFAWLATQLGDDAIRAQADKFGFGHSFDVPMPAVAGRYPENPDVAQTGLTGIGQFDVRASALNMAQVMAAIANQGLTMNPYLVRELGSPSLAVLDKSEPRAYQQAMDPVNATTLMQMMVAVVEKGTGSSAAIPGIRVAGKTGTAENGPNEPTTAWFIAAAPADSPQVAVAVVLQKSGGSGNSSAGPIARAVMQAVLGR